LPRSTLLSLQTDRLAEIEQKLARLPANTDFWLGFYQRLQRDLTRRLAALESADDYTPALLLRRGQAYLLANRPREAWLLFEHLALDENLPAATREEAHYRWIVAATELEIWEEALTIA